MNGYAAREFYDRLADDYHLLFEDLDRSMRWQGEVLAALIRRYRPEGRLEVLDATCGIGTQAVGLAWNGLRVVGTDLSPGAARRAAVEAVARGLDVPVAAADVRALPFADGSFDVVLSADNSFAHLLGDADLAAALGSVRRVLRDGGLLVVTLKEYAEARATRRGVTVPQVTPTAAGRAVTFQLWDWHEDGERYDFEHVQLVPSESDGAWEVRVRRATSRALLQEELTEFAVAAGFTEVVWHSAEESGYYQPVLTGRAA